MKAMIISVGGTPAPVILSLNKQRPGYICFFVSEETKDLIDSEILPNLRFKFRHHDWIVTPNSERLSDCYHELSRNLPEVLAKWDVARQDLIVDYTGGTKTMSVALALATIEGSSRYSYVGGDDRSKGGIGVVVNGKERMWFLDNPWDEIALVERREAAILFNRARYASAVETLDKCVGKVSEGSKAFFRALKEMVEGYGLWDMFNHKRGKAKLYRSLDILSTYASGTGKKEFTSLVDRITDNLNFLDQMENIPEQREKFLCLDLLANAKRRAYLEGKFDDAVARIYRAMEAIAQHKLLSNHGIKTSNVKIEQIPEPLREEYARKYTDERDGKIRIPLYASYRLLKEMGDELGLKFFQHYDGEIAPILKQRNNSILAHGYNTIKGETFEKLYSLFSEFSGIKEEEIPEFPELHL